MVQYVNHSTTFLGSGGDTTLAVPSGVQSGDLLVALVLQDQAGGSPGTPAGWTKLGYQFTAGATAASDVRLAAWVRVASSSEPASYTFTHSYAIARQGGMLAYRGAEFVTAAFASNAIATPTLVESVDGAVLFVAGNGYDDAAYSPVGTARWNTSRMIADERNPVTVPAGTYAPPSAGSRNQVTATIVIRSIEVAPEVSFAGSTSVVAGTVGLSRTGGPREVSFAGDLAPLTGQVALETTLRPEVSFAGSVAQVTGSFSLTGNEVEQSQTVTVNRVYGRTRVMEWSVEVEPPVVESTRKRGHDYAVATSISSPTLVDGRPT